jgi:hypothetical protein
VVVEKVPLSDTNVVKGSTSDPKMGLNYSMDIDLLNKGKVSGTSNLIEVSHMDFVDHSLGIDSVAQTHSETTRQDGSNTTDGNLDYDISVVSRSGAPGVKGWKRQAQSKGEVNGMG